MIDNLPIYRFVVSEDDEAQLDAIAFVDEPAIEMNWQAFNSRQYLFKADNEKRIISGPLMVADLPIYRRTEEGEYYGLFKAEDIYNLRNKFFKQGKSNLVNEMHDSNKMIDGVYMVESFLIDTERGINTPLGFDTLPNGSWFISCKVENGKVWEDFIKTGLFTGFSVEGNFDLKIIKPASKVLESIMEILNSVD